MARTSKSGIRGLYFAGGNYWIDLRWKHPTTGQRHRHREVFPAATPAAAVKKRAMAVLVASIDGSLVPQGEPSPTTNTLGGALDGYTAACVELAQSSLPTKLSHLRTIRSAINADRVLASLTVDDCERVATSLREATKADGTPARRTNATINRHVVTLRHFLAWAGKRGLMERSHARQLCDDLELLPEPPGRVRAVHPDELRKFSEMEGWLRPFVDAARLSGMRQGELASLRWSAVNLSENVITLTVTKANQVRTVSILPELRAVLDRLPRGIGAAFVFPIPRGNRNRDVVRTAKHELARRRETVSLAFARWADRAGLADFRFHDCRHDAATAIRRAGHGLDVIQKVLGHGSLSMSMRYAHLPSDAVRTALGSITIAHPLPMRAVGEVISMSANDTDPAVRKGDSAKRAKGFEPSTFSLGS